MVTDAISVNQDSGICNHQTLMAVKVIIFTETIFCFNSNSKAMAKKPVLSQSRSCASTDLQGYELKTHEFKTLNAVSENNKST